MACQGSLQLDNEHKKQVAVVMVPYLAQSHLNQLLHLSRLLSCSYNLPIHYAGFSTYNHQVKLRLSSIATSSSIESIHFHDFQLPPSAANSPLRHSISHLRQPVFQLLQQLSTKHRRIVVVHDSLMSSVVQDLRSIPNAEAYTFHSISAFTLFFHTWSLIPDDQRPFHLDFDDAIVPSQEGCLSPEMEKFITGQYELNLEFESGRLYNTCRLIEGRFVDLLEKLPSKAKIKHFAIGPFNPVYVRTVGSRHRCLEWLDQQQKDSVIYVSFGTLSLMSDEQIKELAIGLERSGQKFVWVLRTPERNDVDSKEENQHDQLPPRYEERVRDQGMVVREWAPQLEILAHRSTGGFLSHCGWGSCIESISMGVPIATWPMHSDQPHNSALVTKVLRLGMVVRDWTTRNELVKGDRVESVVRRLMASEEGKEMRRRAKEMASVVNESIPKGVASRREMDAFVAHITRS